MSNQKDELSDVINVSSGNKSISLKYMIDDDILDQEPFDPKYYINDECEVDFIKYFEREIRDSYEYKSLIDMFKTVLDISSCVFFKDFSLDNKMKLEFHHHPFTLFDYTQAVLRKQLEENGGWVLENDVERETTMLHYQLVVGLVPLNPTAHAQVHDGKLDIHPDLIVGEYQKFYNDYNKWIPDITKTRYQIYLETYPKDSELIYPDNFKFKPTVINASNKRLITTDKINKLLISDKMDNVNNDYISKMMGDSK